MKVGGFLVKSRQLLNDNSIYFLIQCQYYHHSLEDKDQADV